jgi:hypothetical protein
MSERSKAEANCAKQERKSAEEPHGVYSLEAGYGGGSNGAIMKGGTPKRNGVLAERM